jgi:cell wall-associated NlpC family hydrolase
MVLTKRDLAVQVAWQWYGKPYLWGGDDPLAGIDCSGFVIEILKSVGILPHEGDWTAEELWQRFQHVQVLVPTVGCLAFWGKEKMTHVEFCLDEQFCIGASGGGSKTTSLADAIKDNAYIKVRPIHYRGKPKAFVDPFL